MKMIYRTIIILIFLLTTFSFIRFVNAEEGCVLGDVCMSHSAYEHVAKETCSKWCDTTIGPYFCKCVNNTCQEFQDGQKQCPPTCLGPFSGACPIATTSPQGTDKIQTNYLKQAQANAASNLNPAKFSGPTDVIAIAIKLGLGTIGIVTLALYLWAGFLWATSGGSAEKTGQAAKILVWTTLGVVAILSSYLLVKYLFTAIIG